MDTKRIRWEAGAEAGITAWFGIVGTAPHLYSILRPVTPGDEWVLTCHLPGHVSKVGYADDPDDLKAKAERWLEEFVSSLGAIFLPEPAATGKPDRVTVMLLHDPDSGAVVDLAVYEDDLKAGAEAQEVSDGSGYTVQIWTDRPYIRGTLATGKEG